MATMLRIHLLQQWHSLIEPAPEDALTEAHTKCRFVCVVLISDRILDVIRILISRNLPDSSQSTSAVTNYS